MCFPLAGAWSTPFARWQDPAATTNSLTLAERGARSLERFGTDSWPVNEVVLGSTVRQSESFYGPPRLAARLGYEHASGPWLATALAVRGGGIGLFTAVSR